MITRITFLVLGLLLMTNFTTLAQSGCPGCVITLPPNIAEDTLYLSPIPDGERGVYYESDLSFRMPETTQPVCDLDPESVPAPFCGLALDEVRITDVFGLPAGLDWTANQADGLYTLPAEKDGCVRICGVPLQSGQFTVFIAIDAVLSGIAQGTTFPLEIYIAPSSSSTVGFDMMNGDGCEDLEVSFSNNIPSGGNPGYSYFWDFGNSTFSIEETPGNIIYSEPGEYVVTYTATIDTTDYELKSIMIVNTDCRDEIALPGFQEPDLYIELFDEAGGLVEVTNTADNAALPAVFTFSQILNDEVYSIKVWNEEVLLGDELCGQISFNGHDSGITNYTSPGGELEVAINIEHFVDEIVSTDTVTVLVAADSPIISADGSTVFCEGGQVTFSSNMVDGNSWMLDGEFIAGEFGETLVASLEGAYTLVYTSASGCTATDDMLVTFTPPANCATPTDEQSLMANSFTVYPNPGSDHLFVQFQLEQFSTAEVLVLDIMGRVILNEALGQVSGSMNHNLDMSSFASGTYLIRLQIGDDVFYEKWIK